MMKCPMCTYEMRVEGDTEEDAMMKMKNMGKQHLMDMHKDAPMMEEADMDKMIMDNWKMEM